MKDFIFLLEAELRESCLLLEDSCADFAVPAEEVKSLLIKNFGSVEGGVKTMSSNVNLLSKSIPSWAPGRRDMPVIEPSDIPVAVSLLRRGDDWAHAEGS